MDNIIFYSKHFYYTDIAMFVISIISGILILIKGNKYKYISAYPLSSSLATLIFYFLILNLKYSVHPFMDYIVFLFMKIEYSILAIVFYKRVNYQTSKKIIAFLSLAYSIYSLYEVWIIFKTGSPLTFTNFNQNFFILGISTCLIFSLFKEQPIISILKDPPTIIALGCTAFAICTLPFYIAWDFISPKEQFQLDAIFCLNNIYYSLFFTITALSIICQKQKKSYT